MASEKSVNKRVVELESMLTHLQYDLEQMNDVVLQQQVEINALGKTVHRLEGRLADLAEEPEQRDLEGERPPHY